MIAKWLDNAVAFGLLTAIVLTVLAHGAVEAWSIALFELLITLLLFLWVVKCVIEKRLVLTIPVTFWPIAAFFVLGLIQSIAVRDANGNVSALSIDVEITRHTVFVLFNLLAAHLIAANFFASEKRLKLLAKFLIAFGFVISLLSLIQYFAGGDNIFWFNPQFTSAVWLHGPFVNHNHFAGYIELFVPLAIAVVLTGEVIQTRLIPGFAAVLMTITVVMSASRGGIFSLTISVLFVVLASRYYINYRNKAVSGARDTRAGGQNMIRNYGPALLLTIAIVGGVLWLGLEPVLNRLPDVNTASVADTAETFENSRGWIWANSFDVFRNNPVFGTGMGTFEHALPRYSEGNKATADGKLMVWDRAHNDYLQILADTGLIGGLLALWFIITVVIVAKRGFYLRDRLQAGLALGCAGSILSLMLHSIFDFNLQLPSTSLLFLVLTAVLANLASGHKEPVNTALQKRIK